MADWRTPTTGTYFRGNAIGDVPVWNGVEWLPGPGGGGGSTLVLVLAAPPVLVALPAAPAVGAEWVIKDGTGLASAATPITVSAAPNLIDLQATRPIATAFGALRVRFDSGAWWIV